MKYFASITILLLLPLTLWGNLKERYLGKIQDRHALFSEGHQQYLSGEIEEASQTYFEAIHLFSKNETADLLAIANLAYGVCLFEQQQRHKAIPYLERAYNLGTITEELVTYAYARNVLFNIYNLEGKYQKALALKREIIQYSPPRQKKRQYEANLRAMAALFIKVSAFDSAKVYLDEALAFAEVNQHQQKIVNVKGTYSMYYLALNDYEKALYYQMEQLKHYEAKEVLTRGLAGSKMKIANIYIRMEDWAKAKEYAESALEISDSLNLIPTKIESLMVLGKIAEEAREHQKALATYQYILDFIRPFHLTPRIIKTLHLKGELFQKTQAYLRADSCFTEALNLAEIHQDKTYLYAESLLKLGSLRLEQQEMTTAIPLLEKATQTAFSFEALQIYQKANYALAKAYQLQGQAAIAFQHLQIAYSVKDSLFTIEKAQITQEMGAKYELAKKEKDLVELNLENERTATDLLESKKKQQVFSLGLMALVGTLLFLFQLYRQNKKSKLKLEKLNVSLSDSLHEKEFLLREIHHRVKNNLQIISSMLSLQSDKISDSNTLAVIQEGQNRVESMVLIHEYLYKSENLAMIDCKDYIERLTGRLVDSYQVDLNKIKVVKNIDPIPMKMDEVISLGLMLNELISNALKYAFTKQKEGVLTITLKNKKEGIQLSVEDNGVGLPENFTLKKSETLGFQLIHAFAKKLKAGVAIKKIGGTVVTIDIPKTLISDYEKPD